MTARIIGMLGVRVMFVNLFVFRLTLIRCGNTSPRDRASTGVHRYFCSSRWPSPCLYPVRHQVWKEQHYCYGVSELCLSLLYKTYDTFQISLDAIAGFYLPFILVDVLLITL